VQSLLYKVSGNKNGSERSEFTGLSPTTDALAQVGFIPKSFTHFQNGNCCAGYGRLRQSFSAGARIKSLYCTSIWHYIYIPELNNKKHYVGCTIKYQQ
jgi:hypothetical protein